MEYLNSVLLVVQVLLSISLIALVLIQHGKGADAGAAFGSGASATVFGARGSGNFLSRATTVIAILFFVVCMSLAYLSSNRAAPDSVAGSVTATEPAAPQTMQEIPAAGDLPPAIDGGNGATESDLPPAE